MRTILITAPVDCEVFRDLAYHYQAGELAEDDLRLLDEHADACKACSRYLEVETSFRRALKNRLASEEAPAGLETRIRAALEDEAPTVRRSPWAWLTSPAFAAQAAAVILLGVLAWVAVDPGSLPGGSAPGSSAVQRLVSKVFTIVDHDCDRMGATPEQQQACRDERHLNVLKSADGQYYHVNLDRPLAREIVLDRAQRGRTVVISADFYPDIQTLRLTRVQDAAHL
jgi:anti-sigma factor (TIGR02949 family)